MSDQQATQTDRSRLEDAISKILAIQQRVTPTDFIRLEDVLSILAELHRNMAEQVSGQRELSPLREAELAIAEFKPKLEELQNLKREVRRLCDTGKAMVAPKGSSLRYNNEFCNIFDFHDRVKGQVKEGKGVLARMEAEVEKLRKHESRSKESIEYVSYDATVRSAADNNFPGMHVDGWSPVKRDRTCQGLVTHGCRRAVLIQSREMTGVSMIPRYFDTKSDQCTAKLGAMQPYNHGLQSVGTCFLVCKAFCLSESVASSISIATAYVRPSL